MITSFFYLSILAISQKHIKDKNPKACYLYHYREEFYNTLLRRNNNMNKTGVEIWGEINDIIKFPAKSIKELSEKCFNPLILKRWFSLDSLLSDLNSWLQANDYEELKQCVEDFINELEESYKEKVKDNDQI